MSDSAAGFYTDLRSFQASFRKYLRVTSRTMEVALNGKMRDVMFMAAKHCPEQAQFSQADHDRNRSPAFVTFKTIQRYGHNPQGSTSSRRTLKSGKTAKVKGSFKGPGQLWGMTERNKIARRLRRRHNALRGYIASAFVKAALVFPPAASTVKRPKKGNYKGRLTGAANVVFANPNALISQVSTYWGAKDTRDAGQKYAIARRALQLGIQAVTEDMEKYMADKMNKAAREASAK